jgi:hypothetical protein
MQYAPEIYFYLMHYRDFTDYAAPRLSIVMAVLGA